MTAEGIRALVLGGGSWGTALAMLLSRNGCRVTLWDIDPTNIASLSTRHESRYLPGIAIPDSITATADLADCFAGCGSTNLVVFAVPAQAMRSVARRIKKYIRGTSSLLVNVSKGLDTVNLKRMSEIITEEIEPARSVVSLSGPSHAEEVSRGIPTTVVAASADETAAEEAQSIFMNDRFRVYTNPDIIGVELGGALKNVIAIAAGISDGLGFGDNTKGALITRGLAEISRLGVLMGAKPETFAGLSGMGDLITTCISKFSRNRYVGECLGKGEKLKDILKRMTMVAEGVTTTKAAHRLGRRFGLEMPITDKVWSIMFRGAEPGRAVARLMERDPKPEIYYYSRPRR